MNILKVIGDFNIRHANKRNANSSARGVAAILDENTDFLVREAYNATRTNIIYSIGSERGCKKIMITSASPHEGKTTTSLNVAIAFAQTEARVLIIDADLRKPRINRYLGLTRENGLSDLLCGLIDTEQAIKHSDKYKMDCITSGHIPPNPTELLTSSEMGNLLEKLSEKYDYIFIDTPPVTVVTEAAAMARYVSGVVFVVRQNSTISESLNRARTSIQMANAKILGYILNDVSTASYSYGGYGRYGSSKHSYSYRYGYGYGYGDKEKEENNKREVPKKKAKKEKK